MDNIKISVIIPVYNVEKYLTECVNSVINQTYKNIEIILVDDGSPDSSPALCDEFARQDSRVKVIHKENGGASSARNQGMRNSTGEYIIFLDADDCWIDMSFLESVVENNLSEEKDVVIFGYSKNKTQIERGSMDSDIVIPSGKADFLNFLLLNNRLQSMPWDKIINTKILNNHKMDFIIGHTSEDIDWTARLLIFAKRFDFLDKKVYYYRENLQSVSRNISKKSIIDLKLNIERIIELSEDIKTLDYYNSYMNYCAYQYITFLNCICQVNKKEIIDEVNEMKKYRYLLKYNINNKVKLIYWFNKLFGFNGMLLFLKLFLKLKG